MFGVALFMSALLALADARVYERCELARDLLSLGIRREHLATWVCIAFHESRYDTAARNPSSGDHGILQISELYWCGAGKACGLPCSALRDDDISDDVDCALLVHEEHTRLQGNGFLAWVVYPQHCKHNAKKYLADCDSSVKTATVRTDTRARVLKPQNRNVTSFSYNPKIDELLPPYLTIGSIFRGNYEKQFEQNYNNKVKMDWLNYKIDNIDDLKLPVFNQMVVTQYTTTTLATTTTTTPSPLPKIKPPSPRRIDSNSFRRRKLRPIFDPVKFIETKDPSNNSISQITPGTYRSTTENIKNSENLFPSVSTTYIPLTTTTTTTTTRPTSKNLQLFSSFTTITTAGTKHEMTHFPILYTTNPVKSMISQNVSTASITDLSSTSTMSSIKQNSMTDTDNQSLLGNKENYNLNYASTKAVSILSSTSTTPTVATTNGPFKFEERTSPPTSTTSRTWQDSWLSWRSTPKYKTTVTSTTAAPSPITWRSTQRLSTTVKQMNDSVSKIESINRSTLSTPWNTRRWLYSNTPSTKVFASNNTTTSTESTTLKPYSATAAVISRPTANPTMDPRSTSKITTSTELSSPTTARTTQSIFDLYLNPTKRPKLPTYSFPPFKNSVFSLRIFAGGTTTHAPTFSRTVVPKISLEETANNSTRRQIWQNKS